MRNDVLVHAIRCQIEFARPSDCAHFHPRFGKPRWIDQMRKHPAIEIWAKADNAFDAIDEAYAH